MMPVTDIDNGYDPSQHVIIDTGDGVFDLLNDGDENHGKCSAIFVGSQPSVGEDGATGQYEQLLAYSAKFQVRRETHAPYRSTPV